MSRVGLYLSLPSILAWYHLVMAEIVCQKTVVYVKNKLMLERLSCCFGPHSTNLCCITQELGTESNNIYLIGQYINSKCKMQNKLYKVPHLIIPRFALRSLCIGVH